MGKAGVPPVPGGRRWGKEEVWKRRAGIGAPWRPQDTCPHFQLTHTPARSPPAQVFSDAQQLQPLQVYQAPLSLATVPHQALGRTQSSPAAPGGMKSPPDQPAKHLFTTGEPHHCQWAFHHVPGVHAWCLASCNPPRDHVIFAPSSHKPQGPWVKRTHCLSWSLPF